MRLYHWILIVTLFYSIFIYGCRSPEFESQWSGQPIVIDGNNSDWQGIPLHQLESVNVSLGLSNTEDDLYLYLHLKDPSLVMRTARGGVNFKLSDQEDGDPLLEFHYTGYDSLQPFSKPPDSFWDSLLPEEQKKYIREQKIIQNQIRVLINGQSVLIAPDGSRGIAAARIDKDKHLIGYELSVPIQKDNHNIYALGIKPGQSFYLGLSLGKNRSDMDVDMTMPSAEMPAGGGMMDDFNGREGRGPVGTESPEEVNELWLQIKLAGQ